MKKFNFIPQVQELIDKLEVKVVHHSEHGRTPGVWFGMYEPSVDLITLTDLCQSTYTTNLTVLHEIIHWTGVKSRMNRSVFQGDAYFEDMEAFCTEEMIAEIGMVYLAVYIGFIDAEHGARILEDSKAKYSLANLKYAEVEAKKSIQFILDALLQKEVA